MYPGWQWVEDTMSFLSDDGTMVVWQDTLTKQWWGYFENELNERVGPIRDRNAAILAMVSRHARRKYNLGRYDRLRAEQKKR